MQQSPATGPRFSQPRCFQFNVPHKQRDESHVAHVVRVALPKRAPVGVRTVHVPAHYDQLCSSHFRRDGEIQTSPLPLPVLHYIRGVLSDALLRMWSHTSLALWRAAPCFAGDGARTTHALEDMAAVRMGQRSG